MALHVLFRCSVDMPLERVSDAEQFCCPHSWVHRLITPAIPMTFFRYLALLVPVATCCEVLCYQSYKATALVREALENEATGRPSGAASTAAFESIAKFNASLVSARLSLQPLLVIGVAFCMMWGSLVAILWVGGTELPGSGV